MRNSSINVYDQIEVSFDYEVEIDDILDLVEQCDKDEKARIVQFINDFDDDGKRKRRKVLSIEEYVDVDFEYDVDFYQVVELVSNCSDHEKLKIVEDINFDSDIVFRADNLYDEQRIKLLFDAYKKYDIDELKARLA